MIEVDIAPLEKAIREVVATATDVEGRKLYVGKVSYDDIRVQHAATMAMMTLLGTFVRPRGLKFVSGFNSSDVKTF